MERLNAKLKTQTKPAMLTKSRRQPHNNKNTIKIISKTEASNKQLQKNIELIEIQKIISTDNISKKTKNPDIANGGNDENGDKYESDNSDNEKIIQTSNMKKFEEIIIKNEHHENIYDKEDSPQKKQVGERQPTIAASRGIVSTSLVLNKAASVPTANRTFIIKNLAGKSVTIIPKSTPVVLNKDTNIKSAVLNSNNINKSVVVNNVSNKTVVLTEDTKKFLLKKEAIKIVKPVGQCKNLIQQLPNTHFMKIADLNKSQRYFSPEFKKLTIEKTESLARIAKPEVPQPPQIIDLTEEKEEMQKNANTNKMPNFSKFLQVLAESPTKNSGTKKFTDAKIPIYVDCETQTENLTAVKDCGVQTEIYMPSPTPSFDDLPNITNLLEYVLNTPKYCTGLDEMKKNDLIDMSKNIAMKSKHMPQEPRGPDSLKQQLFYDLKDCATFDFLGNKPIHNAVLENNIGLLKRQIFALRLRKISLDLENNQGQTALQLAVSNNCNLEIISNLLGNGASANILDHEGNNLIHLAVMNSTHFVLEIIIKYIIDPVKEIDRKNDEGLTALMIASIDSKPEMVDMLLRNKADPNLRDEKSGRTALFHAVELNCTFVINLLLKYKADPKVRNFFGLTALDAAKDLDIPDSKILETENETNLQTSIIVNMSNEDANAEHLIVNGNKRNSRSNGAQKGAKKSRLSFVPALMKVGMNEIKKASSNTRKRKK